MSPRKKTIAILALGTAGFLAFGFAIALPARLHHGGPFGEFGFGGGMARALASLELTDGQKAQVKAILADEGPKVEPLVDELLQSKKGLFEAVHAGTFDEKAVRAAASGAARAETELAVERARMVSRFRDILTDEQQDRLEAIREKFEERIEKHIGLARTLWKEHAADFIDALWEPVRPYDGSARAHGTDRLPRGSPTWPTTMRATRLFLERPPGVTRRSLTSWSGGGRIVSSGWRCASSALRRTPRTWRRRYSWRCTARRRATDPKHRSSTGFCGLRPTPASIACAKGAGVPRRCCRPWPPTQAPGWTGHWAGRRCGRSRPRPPGRWPPSSWPPYPRRIGRCWS